jgi:hypothetical protein
VWRQHKRSSNLVARWGWNFQLKRSQMVPRSDLAVTALWCRNRRVGRPQRVENSPSPPVRLDVSYWALNPAKRRTASGRKPVRTPARSSHRGGAARRIGARKPRHRMERPLADVKIEGWTAVSGKATSPGQWLERLLHPFGARMTAWQFLAATATLAKRSRAQIRRAFKISGSRLQANAATALRWLDLRRA